MLTTTSGVAQEIASTLSALSPTNLTAVLGVAVLTVSTPIVGTKAVGAPPPPPWPDCYFGGQKYYTPVSPSRCEYLGRLYEIRQAEATATLVGGIAGGVVGCICLVAAWWYCRRRRKRARAQLASRTVGPNLPAPARQMAASEEHPQPMPPPPPPALHAVAVSMPVAYPKPVATAQAVPMATPAMPMATAVPTSSTVQRPQLFTTDAGYTGNPVEDKDGTGLAEALVCFAGIFFLADIGLYIAYFVSRNRILLVASLSCTLLTLLTVLALKWLRRA